MGIIAGLVTFMKGVKALRDLGEMFITAWVTYNIDQVNDQAEDLKRDLANLNAMMKRTTNDEERIALLRAINRL